MYPITTETETVVVTERYFLMSDGVKLYTRIVTPIAFTVKKGSKIRVDISSEGGIYVPHANVKGHWAEVTETKIANNTLLLKDSFFEFNVK